MSISDITIRRPVFATVISLLIVVAGIAGLSGLAIRELPDVDRATVTVTTTYSGAAPEIIDTEIVEVLEAAISGVDGIETITSISRLGRGHITVEFSSRRDIDQAANDIRDAVGRVLHNLPDEADTPRIVKADTDAQPIMRISITSDRMTAAEITDYATRFIVDRLSVLEGVAQVETFGERRYAIRIWLDRRALASRGLAVSDIDQALRRHNIELPAGEIESDFRQFTVRSTTRLRTVEDFRNISLGQVRGYTVRLGDIAEIELGVADDRSQVRMNGTPAIGLGIIRQAQANTIAVSDRVREQLDLMRPILPEGMSVAVASDDAAFIRQSIREVLIALGISLCLVVGVILVFLHSARATMVPVVTIPVALVGTLGVMALFGFSLNVLTLLALLLAIGLVVDDAIVVLENIKRRVEGGEQPLAAAFLGTRQVTFAVIATSLTLIAVFVPISMMEGNVGRLFREFGIVMASAVAISTFVALSLCAMLCSKLLRPETGKAGGAIGRGMERAFRGLAAGYRWLLARALRIPVVILFAAGCLSVTSAWLYAELPKELTPPEDRGMFFIPVTAPQGATAAYTDENLRKIEGVLLPLIESGEAFRVFAVSAFRGRAERGIAAVGLTDWSERERSQQEIVRGIVPDILAIPGVRAFPVNPAGLGQRGSSQPLRVVVGGPDYESVKEWADEIIARGESNPRLLDLDTDFEATRPQIDVTIDRRRAADLGVDVEQIGRTLQTLFASREITDFVDRGRVYPVLVQALRDDRRTPSDLSNAFVRAASGDLVPLGALVAIEETASAPELRRYNRLPSVTISSALEEGYDLGSAIAYMQEVAAEVLPPEARLGYAGQSLEFLRTSEGVMLTFALALVIVFLVLAAQFESFVHPFIIIVAVPLAVTGALASLAFTGMSLNVYTQIGIVLLIGLTAKNGILIVEFANQLRAQGRTVREAIEEGAALRFRPILMTVLSTLFGAIPLVLASGAGAESRMAIGVVVMGGLGFASLLTLFVIPVLYDLLARFARPSNAVALELERQIAARPGNGRRAAE